MVVIVTKTSPTVIAVVLDNVVAVIHGNPSVSLLFSLSFIFWVIGRVNVIRKEGGKPS